MTEEDALEVSDVVEEISDDAIEKDQLVGSVKTSEKTLGSDVLRKSLSNLPATKFLPSLMDLIHAKDIPAASNYKARFGFEEEELNDFINEVTSAKYVKLPSQSTIKGKRFIKLFVY